MWLQADNTLSDSLGGSADYSGPSVFPAGQSLTWRQRKTPCTQQQVGELQITFLNENQIDEAVNMHWP